MAHATSPASHASHSLTHLTVSRISQSHASHSLTRFKRSQEIPGWVPVVGQDDAFYAAAFSPCRLSFIETRRKEYIGNIFASFSTAQMQ
jgi:hypothetical protein